MTPFMKWLRATREKFLGSFYDGPDPPERLVEMVIVFANEHPRATRKDWIAFASGHAGESYRSGYVRGAEWTERDLERQPEVSPETIADRIDSDWRWRRGVVIEGGIMEVVPDEWPEPMLLEEQMDCVNRVNRGRR